MSSLSLETTIKCLSPIPNPFPKAIVVTLGYKVKLFSSNESLMGTIRRIYRQLETSKSQINKQYAKDLRNSYFNPLEIPPTNITDWFKLLMQNFNPMYNN